MFGDDILTAPTLTGLTDTITFDENTVNDRPQLLDADVTLIDPDDDWNGGTLTLTGLLAEDTVSVQNVGMGAGQIGLSGSNVMFAGVTIGTLVGGDGADLTITFNATATTAMVESVIENLTYANSSDAPVANRDFVLNITDANGDDLTGDFIPSNGFVDGGELTGSSNPLDGIVVGRYARAHVVDINGDGDLDIIVTSQSATRTFQNTDGGFIELTGIDNPFATVVVAEAPSLIWTVMAT